MVVFICSEASEGLFMLLRFNLEVLESRIDFLEIEISSTDYKYS